ncbi:hypothetical protein QBC32DRAFT_135231 [Pseudoneurospora amorphoporcata]|uniref:Transmembrane protein n=1 Tax=Pseudoneurospora amorphoporcata TaxID=241081 RepID=A0AAN6NVN9_9PEZI|nr:hypothetical protein QBC32DRAFT_135231 [Pseudoneurospora amorphoporcata]
MIWVQETYSWPPNPTRDIHQSHLAHKQHPYIPNQQTKDNSHYITFAFYTFFFFSLLVSYSLWAYFYRVSIHLSIHIYLSVYIVKIPPCFYSHISLINKMFATSLCNSLLRVGCLWYCVRNPNRSSSVAWKMKEVSSELMQPSIKNRKITLRCKRHRMLKNVTP